jgi:hypothetical protein
MLTSTLPAVADAAVSQAPSKPAQPSLSALSRTARLQFDAVRATLETLRDRISAIDDSSADARQALQVYTAAVALAARIDAILPVLS